jgi:hypothetical protein
VYIVGKRSSDKHEEEEECGYEEEEGEEHKEKLSNGVCEKSNNGVRKNPPNSRDSVREGANVKVSVLLPAELAPHCCLELRFVGVHRGGPVIFLWHPEGDVDANTAG